MKPETKNQTPAAQAEQPKRGRGGSYLIDDHTSEPDVEQVAQAAGSEAKPGRTSGKGN